MTYIAKDRAGISASRVTRYYCDVHGVFEISRWPENEDEIHHKIIKHCSEFHKGLAPRY